jgi:transposase
MSSIKKLVEENNILLEELEKLRNTKNDIEGALDKLINDNDVLTKENKTLISENKKLTKLLETDSGSSTPIVQHNQKELIQLKKYLTDNNIDILNLIAWWTFDLIGLKIPELYNIKKTF